MPECGTRPTIRECAVPNFDTATLEQLTAYEECLEARLDDANRRLQWTLCMAGEGPPPPPPIAPVPGEVSWLKKNWPWLTIGGGIVTVTLVTFLKKVGKRR